MLPFPASDIASVAIGLIVGQVAIRMASTGGRSHPLWTSGLASCIGWLIGAVLRVTTAASAGQYAVMALFGAHAAYQAWCLDQILRIHTPVEPR